MSTNEPRTEAGQALLKKARTVDGWHTNFDAGDILAIENEAEASAGAAPLDVTALARAMKAQHAALMPDAKPLSDELVAAMATDLLARLAEGADR